MAKSPKLPKRRPRDLLEVVEEVAVYPPEAYEFLQAGLHHTVTAVHAGTAPDESHHVSGQQLCLGLRAYAWKRWGYMARTVLARWNVTATTDFGRIVYALIDAGVFSKTDADSIDDFRNVYDFRTLETEYVPGAGGSASPDPDADLDAGQTPGHMPGQA